jgi:hypothetical protein
MFTARCGDQLVLALRYTLMCLVLFSPLCACSRKRLDASGVQHQEQEILEINVRPGWKSGTKITFQEKGERKLRVTLGSRAAAACLLSSQSSCSWTFSWVLPCSKTRSLLCVWTCVWLVPILLLTIVYAACAWLEFAGDENPGRIAADIVFVLHEKANDVFKRDGNDLIYTHR